MIKIRDIEIGYYRLPLEGNLVDALHGRHDRFELITATVLLDNGVSGVGYTYTGGIGGLAITKLLEKDLKPLLVGKGLDDLHKMNYFMNKGIHYIARGGIASFAISALDIALWDATLKTEKKALADIFGTRQEKVRTYHGGIDLMLTEKELLQSIEKKLEEGHNAVKIKIGKENMDEDIRRIRAVRELIGKESWFAIDANMIYSVADAIKLANAAEKYNIAWFEEPTDPDDYKGYAEIGKHTNIPIAMGENLHTAAEHILAMDIGNVKELIPDCSNICGITGFFEVADAASNRGVAVNSHGMQELHVNVLGALEKPGLVEYHSFPIYEYTKEPLIIKEGMLTPNTCFGTGVSFDFEKINSMKL